MTMLGWAQIAVFCACIIGITRPLGGYLTRLATGERLLLSPLIGPLERGIYRMIG